MIGGTWSDSVIDSQLVCSSARAVTSAGPLRLISSATTSGTMISLPANRSMSRRSALARKIKGDALTTGHSATSELTLQVVKVDHEGILLLVSEHREKVRAIQPSDFSSLFL